MKELKSRHANIQSQQSTGRWVITGLFYRLFLLLAKYR